MGRGKVNNTPDDDSGLFEFDWSGMEFLANTGHAPEPTESNVHETRLTPETLAKRLVWDVTPCNLAVKAAEVMGLSPASEDVEEMEHSESHDRLLAPASIGMIIDAMSQHAAHAVLAAQVAAHNLEMSDEDMLENTQKLQPLVFQTTYSIIAELLDIGAVHLPEFMFVGTEDVEG